MTESRQTLALSKPKGKGISAAYQWQYWLFLAIPLAYLLIFHYAPMVGIIIAFKDYTARGGIFGSEWAGLKHFKQFLSTPSSSRIIGNTLRIGLYQLLVGFPFPIILAIFLNEVKSLRFRKTVQMVTYAPYFISTVVLVGMMMRLFDLRSGPINQVITMLGGKPMNFFGNKDIFPHLYVWSGIWQGAGYNSIIFIAALAGVNPELKEAARIDGASRFQRIWNVDLPSIASTIVMMLIFNVGAIMNIGFEKVFLMQNPANQPTSEIISTFVYKVGLGNGNYSFSTAVNLFNSILSLILFVIANQTSKKISDTSIW